MNETSVLSVEGRDDDDGGSAAVTATWDDGGGELTGLNVGLLASLVVIGFVLVAVLGYLLVDRLARCRSDRSPDKTLRLKRSVDGGNGAATTTTTGDRRYVDDRRSVRTLDGSTAGDLRCSDMPADNRYLKRISESPELESAAAMGDVERWSTTSR